MIGPVVTLGFGPGATVGLVVGLGFGPFGITSSDANPPLTVKDTCYKTEPPKRGFTWSPLTDCPPVNV
jgi:hypothetical protein